MAMYLDVMNPKIDGESSNTVNDWNKKIQIESMDYGVSQQASVKTGTGLVASGSTVGHLSIRKEMDKSTPLLWYHLASGTPLETVVLRVSRAGAKDGPFEAETYVLENVIVSSYNTSGMPGMGGLPEEGWSLAFTKMTERHQTVDRNGILQAAETHGFDFGKGTEYAAPIAQKVNSWVK